MRKFHVEMTRAVGDTLETAFVTNKETGSTSEMTRTQVAVFMQNNLADPDVISIQVTVIDDPQPLKEFE